LAIRRRIDTIIEHHSGVAGHRCPGGLLPSAVRIADVSVLQHLDEDVGQRELAVLDQQQSY
jgi:hypothetical protein